MAARTFLKRKLSRRTSQQALPWRRWEGGSRWASSRCSLPDPTCRARWGRRPAASWRRTSCSPCSSRNRRRPPQCLEILEVEPSEIQAWDIFVLPSAQDFVRQISASSIRQIEFSKENLCGNIFLMIPLGLYIYAMTITDTIMFGGTISYPQHVKTNKWNWWGW